jgi:hypothetical protein
MRRAILLSKAEINFVIKQEEPSDFSEALLKQFFNTLKLYIKDKGRIYR